MSNLLRILVIIVGISIAMVFLTGIILTLPATHKYITRQVNIELKNTIATPISVGYIQFNWPGRLSVHDIFVKCDSKEDLFSIGYLSKDVNPLKLIRKELLIRRLIIEHANISLCKDRSDSVFNILISHFLFNANHEQ